MPLLRKIVVTFLLIILTLSSLQASKLVLFRIEEKSEIPFAFDYGVRYINVESGYFAFNVSCNFDSPVLFTKAIKIDITYGEPWITRLSHSSSSYSSSSVTSTKRSSINLIQVMASFESTTEYLENEALEIIKVLENFVMSSKGSVLEITHSGHEDFGVYGYFSRDIIIKIDGEVVYSQEF